MSNFKTLLGLSSFILLGVGCSGDGKVLSREGSGGSSGSGGGRESGGSIGNGDSGGSATSGSGGTTVGATGGTAPIFGAGGTSLLLDCSPACTDGKVCSPALRCLDPGACLADTDCFQGQVCTGGVCQAGGACGSAEFQVAGVAPNLLLLLDRSCTMQPPRWPIAVDALMGLTTTFSGRVRWGLTVFPDTTGAQCAQDPPLVLPAPGTEPQIQGLLGPSRDSASNPLFPDGPCVTNGMAAVTQAQALPELRNPNVPNYMLLITDGHTNVPECSGGRNNNDTAAEDQANLATAATITQMAAEGIKTFVLGFAINPSCPGTPTATCVDVLNSFAVAGGVPNPDPAYDYYPADENLPALQAALDGIVGSIVGCDFSLDTVPPTSESLYVFLNNLPLDRDTADGWTYDAPSNRVIFTGASCNTLKAGGVDIDVVYGCKQPAPN